MQLQCLVGNITGTTRREKLQGKDYLVAPLTLIVPGVLKGSEGPLMYEEEDITENLDSWNNIPIVVDHPTGDNGAPVSARRPDILNDVGIGFVFNAQYDGKLIAEGWFDVEQTRNIDHRILDAVRSGKSMEVSTGLFTKNEPAPESATHNGKSFSAYARKHRPDHLAILPDQVGACSIGAGCGLNVNSSEVSVVFVGFTGASDGHIHGANLDYTGFGFTSEEDGHSHVVSDFNVQEADGHIHELSRDSLVDSGIRNQQDSNINPPISSGDLGMKLTETDKKVIVDNLVANCECWKEEDRKTLNEYDDRTLSGLNSSLEAGTKTKELELVANAATKGFKDATGVEHVFNTKSNTFEIKPADKEEPTNNAESKKKTSEEWFDSAPEEVQAAVRNSMNIVKEEKIRLVEQLTANASDDQKEAIQAVYNDMGLEELKIIAQTLPAKQSSNPFSQSYEGSAAPTGNLRTPEIDPEDHLTIPTINWEENSKQRTA